MSDVRTVTVLCAEFRPILSELNSILFALMEHSELEGFVLVSGLYGGDKFAQCQTYGVAINGLPSGFVDAVLKGIAWENPANVVIVLQPDEGATEVHRPRDWELFR